MILYLSLIHIFAENEAFSQTSVKVYLKTDDMLFSGGNGTGLSFYIKYAEESTEDNPCLLYTSEERRTIFAIGTDMKSITENVVAQAVGTAPSIGGSCNVKA